MGVGKTGASGVTLDGCWEDRGFGRDAGYGLGSKRCQAGRRKDETGEMA
ncbi:MAG: hypothetical protein HFH92_07260 [Lachnospiraceae bacterium]|nr:hypothetical protein [uncultured Acetatifactor sp.]MCI8788890.1 hypothetical protein [Lachnospiraceae bacterium]